MSYLISVEYRTFYEPAAVLGRVLGGSRAVAGEAQAAFERWLEKARAEIRQRAAREPDLIQRAQMGLTVSNASAWLQANPCPLPLDWGSLRCLREDTDLRVSALPVAWWAAPEDPA